MSHRYGTRCLPTRIIAKEYDILRKELHSFKELNEIDLSFTYEGGDRTIHLSDLFQDCYELDENEIPARYKLKFLESLIPKYNEKVF